MASQGRGRHCQPRPFFIYTGRVSAAHHCGGVIDFYGKSYITCGNISGRICMGGRLFKITILVFLLCLMPFDALAQDKVFNILYTGAIKGELEPCGCSPKSSSGGLARLSGHLSPNKEGLKPYLLLD